MGKAEIRGVPAAAVHRHARRVVAALHILLDGRKHNPVGGSGGRAEDVVGRGKRAGETEHGGSISRLVRSQRLGKHSAGGDAVALRP